MADLQEYNEKINFKKIYIKEKKLKFEKRYMYYTIL